MVNPTGDTGSKRTLTPDEAAVLALKRKEKGDIAGAERLLRKILRAASDHARSHYELGILYLQTGRVEDALIPMRRAAELSPDRSPYQLGLGIALEKNKRLDQAEESYRRAIELEPRLAENHYNLAHLYQEQGRLKDAEAAYRRAVELKSDYVDAHNNLGTVLQLQEKLTEAKATYRQAVSLTPNDADLHYNLGCVLGELEEKAEAENAYRRAIELRPDYGGALLNLSTLLREEYKFEAAEPFAKRALEVTPGDLEVVANYALCHSYGPDEPELEVLRSYLKHQDLTHRQKIVMLYALGKVHDDIGQYSEAFAFYRQANSESGKAHTFDRAHHLKMIDNIKETFPEPSLTTSPAARSSLPIPIFVVGMSRSGKTLVESLLARHPAVHGAGERQEFQEALATVLEGHGIGGNYPNYVVHVSEERAHEIGALYLERISALSPQAKFIVNTLPGNYAYIGLILMCLPQAKIIHALRDPLDNCLYIYFKQYRHGHEYAYDLQDLVTYYRSYQDLMGHWRGLYRDRILEVRYEDMVSDATETASRFYAFCGLDIDPGAISSNFSHREIGRCRNYRDEFQRVRETLEK